MTHPHDPPDELQRLAGAPPPPRRTDAAFARSVADEVKRRRSPLLFLMGAPALALAAAGVAVMVAGPGPGELRGDAGITAPRPALAERVATADLEWGEDSDFALPSLEGSTDEELLRLDRALDEALKKRM